MLSELLSKALQPKEPPRGIPRSCRALTSCGSMAGAGRGRPPPLQSREARGCLSQPESLATFRGEPKSSSQPDAGARCSGQLCCQGSPDLVVWSALLAAAERCLCLQERSLADAGRSLTPFQLQDAEDASDASCLEVRRWPCGATLGPAGEGTAPAACSSLLCEKRFATEQDFKSHFVLPLRLSHRGPFEDACASNLSSYQSVDKFQGHLISTQTAGCRIQGISMPCRTIQRSWFV